MRDTYRILVGKPKAKMPVGRELKGRGERSKIVHMHNYLRTTPLRCMGEWIYRSTHS
jgi:hypothetical protein